MIASSNAYVIRCGERKIVVFVRSDSISQYLADITKILLHILSLGRLFSVRNATTKPLSASVINHCFIAIFFVGGFVCPPKRTFNELL